jgi:hypothetical protein
MMNLRRGRLANMFGHLSMLATLGILGVSQLASDAGAGGGGAASGEPGGTPPAPPTPPDPGTPPADPPAPPETKPDVKFDKAQQAEVDRIVAEEKRKAADKAKGDTEKAIQEAAARAKMDEAERLKAEKADAEKASKDATEKANQRVVRVETKAAALVAGVKPDAIGEFMAVVDTSAIELDKDGEPDEKAIAKAIKTVLDKPTFKAAFTGAAGTKSPGAGEHNGNGDRPRASNLDDAVAAAIAAQANA